MLKVQYYETKKDLYNDLVNSGGKTVLYDESMFTGLMCGSIADEEDRPPFRDAESQMILKESFGIELVEDDWYSIISDGRRTCLSDLSSDLKYALVLIDESRNGNYLKAKFMQAPVWDAVRKVPFDILIACTWEDIFWTTGSGKLPHSDYVIYGLPYGGDNGIYVCRLGSMIDNDFYTPMRPVKPGEFREGVDIENYLYIGKDGKYYASGLSGVLRFYWRQHLNEMLEYIDNLKYPKKLKMIEDTYSISEFNKMIEPELKEGIFEAADGDYLWQLNMCKKKYKKGEITAAEYRGEVDRLRKTDGYQEYLYYRDKFKIVNHMYELPPKEMYWRKVPILSVRINKDGSYMIGGGISNKYPWQEEILGDAIDMRSSDYDTFLLYVDANEMIDRPEDLDKMTWAIWVRQDSIELFDKWDGLRLFAVAVRNALASGRCEISEAFY